LAQSIVTLFGISVIIFLAVRLTGDPVLMMLPPTATLEQIEELRRALALDAPPYVQYFTWILNALRGDLGTSLVQSRPVLSIIFERLPATITLSLFAVGLSTATGIPLGIISASRRDSPVSQLAVFASLVGQSIPLFCLGILLILIFSVNLGWLPTSGAGSWKHLIMPGVVLAAHLWALLTRFVRAGLMEVLNEPFIRTARAKGLSERVVLYKHAVRNVAIRVITLLGVQLGTLLGGTVVVETVFAWPGIGRLAVQAVYLRDFPMVQALALVVAALFLFINLMVDVIYAWVDPRIRLS
jgi:ABC-type dipeptide/oligopeptide/nickel transport system permease component